MAFVMPAKMKAGDISKPLDSALKVRELPGGRFAVLRYSGERSAKNETESLERLRAWMREESLKEISLPVYGYFDPPWTPPFLRRNEVMLQIEKANP